MPMRPPQQALHNPYRFLLVLLCGLLVCTLPAVAGNKRVTLQQKKTRLQTKINTIRKQLSYVRKVEHQKRVVVHSTQQRYQAARATFMIASQTLKRKQIELKRASNALSAAQMGFKKAQGDVGDRLVAIYERGQQGHLDLLTSSRNFSHLLQRAELARFLADQDRAALKHLKEQKERVASYQHQVRAKTAEVAAWQSTVRRITQRRKHETWEAYSDLKGTADYRQDMEAELVALEKDSRDVTAMLRAMQNTAPGRKRFHTVYAGPVSGLPVNGRITSPFGYRYHPILHTRKLHTGVDIAAPIGTPIFAVGGGCVVWASRRGGYGNCVIIDHGGGRATLYGHMSAIAVHAGETVSRRQVIGYVGSTGVSTGPHCHFELRINGEPVNPL